MEESDVHTLAEGRYLSLVKRGRWEFVRRKNITGIVLIAPMTSDGKIVLVKQYRAPLNAQILELPAGLVGDVKGREDEPFIEATRRELLEETGYEAGTLTRVAEGPVSPGSNSENVTFFVAKNLRKTGRGGGEKGENITVHEVPVENIHPWLKEMEEKGVLVDLKVFAGLYFAMRDSSRSESSAEAG